MKECVCGYCSFETDPVTGNRLPNYSPCKLPEAVRIIRELLMASSWAGSKINLEAEAFIKKVSE